ncbi:hypothetical protein TBLA_0C02640 [Henningerozyma blattae CBS 6284]|uniref:Uncharacterized protein n=1 Tax=Henningerozyma blattae (strain ATCC 34711 / CBS 6284 / DSM 70876 / NBRC 10599 / NRRL Y-10934 / UCD 77-7) TaxID=1071380 RepID=I2H121_HENB6|nr:hypothetical protein TBLA_0C02640 [Tetrapisispora blattae CBS 6284]CCH60073.1 hypothetical protein TBLA_0C02640 [Tetrapisispora blattae CBS 6284]
MSRKQEYIAKLKYRNTLPAPLLPPKLMKYTEIPQEQVDSPEIISSLYTKTTVSSLVNVDNDLGLPLDLMKFPGLLDKMDTRLLFGYEGIKLDPKDRVLLRDPRMDRLTKTDISKVNFLRRTEYVSSVITSGNNTNTSTNSNGINNRKRGYPGRSNEDDLENILNSSQITERVENTFNSISKDLKTLKHPVKKNLHAVKTWSLLPDTASMDQSYFTLRLTGSALLDPKEKITLNLSTALFRPVELEEDEWISMYTTDKEGSNILENEVEKKIDETLNKENSEEDRIYKFKRLRDFDMRQVPNTTNSGSFGELALIFNDEDNIAYYKPLRSRIELKRRRVNDVLRPIVRENNIDQINISLRNPTTQEANSRDNLRTRFDPINFPSVDEEFDNNDDNNNINDE